MSRFIYLLCTHYVYIISKNRLLWRERLCKHWSNIWWCRMTKEFMIEMYRENVFLSRQKILEDIDNEINLCRLCT